VSKHILSNGYIGDLVWGEIADLALEDPVRRASSPIANIVIPVMRTRCTSFLISKDILITSGHCVPHVGAAKRVMANFRHLGNEEDSSEHVYDCSTFLMSSMEHDFALLKCEGSPGEKYGVVDIDLKDIEIDSLVYVVQQNCDYLSKSYCEWTKKYSKGLIMHSGDDRYYYNADTLGGSSGSPVIDENTHKVIGIHTGGKKHPKTGKTLANYSSKMSHIVSTINKYFPELLNSKDQESFL